MLTLKQMDFYNDFCQDYSSQKNEKDFQRLSGFSFVANNKIHTLEYTREGIEGYSIKKYNPNESYTSLRPLIDKERKRLYT